MKTSSLLCFAIAAALALFEPSRAEACGGCFVQQTERTVVTDHRMALSISPQETVLWDQIRYSGDPAEFAWVLPVRVGAKVQLSNDAFFTALDASTQPVVLSPATYGGGFGCGLTGCGSQTASESAGAPGPGQVQIVSQSVVGPYETVTLRATDPGALRAWLKSHAYAIPPSIEPTIDAYVRESFDFIALRLRPDCGERSMQPVRIVTPGADPTLPLRMVAAGVGAKVGLTLYVISEGRYQAQNFPNAKIEDAKLTWDRVNARSNYEPYTEELMAQQGGRTWVTEYADRPELREGTAQSTSSGTSGAASTPGLADVYYGLCKSRVALTPVGQQPSAQPFTPCRNQADAGIAQGSGEADAAADSGQSSDAGVDGGEDDAGELADGGTSGDGGNTANDSGVPTTPPHGDECAYLDDLRVATRGLHADDVWVTRLRASLPSNALSAGDLRLEAAKEQTVLLNVHYANAFADEVSAGSGSGNACLSAPKRHTAFGTWTLAALVGLAGVGIARRHRRR